MQAFDIIVIGGGLVGSSFCLGLDPSIKVALIEAHKPDEFIEDNFDARSLALSYNSIEILKNLKAWSTAEAQSCSIKTVHVSAQKHFGTTKIKATDYQLDYLGAVTPLGPLNYQLFKTLQTKPGCTLFSEAQLTELSIEANQVEATIKQNGQATKLNAKLIIAADGSHSTVKKLLKLNTLVDTHDYGKSAVVANVRLKRGHQNIAYERFTPNGPLALLPMTRQRANLVWSVSPLRAKKLVLADETSFLAALQKAFGYRLGRFVEVGKRASFPLIASRLNGQCTEALFIGNACQTLHPVAGQGFNLGLRDAISLANLINTQCKNVIDPPKLIETYHQLRKKDKNQTFHLTHTLAKVFTQDWLALTIIRSLGLNALSQIPPIKNKLGLVAMNLNNRPANLIMKTIHDRNKEYV